MKWNSIMVVNVSERLDGYRVDFHESLHIIFDFTGIPHKAFMHG